MHRVPQAAAGIRLIDHLRQALGGVQSRRLGALVTEERILVDGGRGVIAHRLRGGELLTFAPGAVEELQARMIPVADLGLVVALEDDDLLVIDKPAGMQVHPMGRHRDATVVGGLLWLAGARPDHLWTDWRPHLVNRLDRPTSGLVLVAKRGALHTHLQSDLESGRVRRTYLARVTGQVEGASGTVDAPLGRDPEMDYRRGIVAVADGGQEAVTHWRVVGRSPDTTLLEVELETGRTHQIRAHLASLGHPIVGDRLYASATPPETGDTIALHAVALAFTHPTTGRPIRLTSPVPGRLA